MTEFKVGDRVRVYDKNYIYSGKVTKVVSEIQRLHVLIDPYKEENMQTCPAFYFQQCRRLKKKERRRIWVCAGVFNDHIPPINTRFTKPENEKSWIEFIEVKKK